MQDHEILAVLMSSKEVYKQFADTDFDGMQAGWIKRTIDKHLAKYDELADDDAWRYYIEQEGNEQIKAVLPIYIAKIKSVNVSAFKLDQVQSELLQRKQQAEINRLLDACSNGDYAEVLQEVASYREVVECSPLLLDDMEIPPDPERVTQWLGWRGESTLLDAPPKLGKSTVGANDAIPLLNDGGTVLWVSGDEPVGTVIRRFRKLDAMPKKSKLYIMHRSLDISWAMIHAWCEQIQPDVIYFDAFHSLTARLEGKIPQSFEIEECRKIADKFTQLADKYECAIVMFVHQAKNKGDGGAAGSVQISAAFDMLCSAKQTPKSDCKPIIKFKGRFETDKALHLEYLGPEGGCIQIVEQDATAIALIHVLEHITPGINYDNLMKATGLTRDTLKKRLTDIRKMDWIIESPTGKGKHKTFGLSPKGTMYLVRCNGGKNNDPTVNQ